MMFDLLLMDPPYRRGFLPSALSELETRRIYHQESILVIQHDRREPLLTFQKAGPCCANGAWETR